MVFYQSIDRYSFPAEKFEVPVQRYSDLKKLL